MNVQGIVDNLNRIRREQGNVGPEIKAGQIRPQIRNTSRNLNPIEKIPVKLLVSLNNKGQGSRHYQGPDQFQPNDTVYASRSVNGFIYLYPFEMAGSGFEIHKDAVEGVHYEFI